MEDHETQLGVLEATRARAHTHTQHPFPLPEGSGCLWRMQKAQMSLPLSHSSPGLRQSTCVRAFIALSSLSQVASMRLLWARIWRQSPGAACSMLRASSLRACTLAGPRIWTSSLKASNFSPRTCKSIEHYFVCLFNEASRQTDGSGEISRSRPSYPLPRSMAPWCPLSSCLNN